MKTTCMIVIAASLACFLQPAEAWAEEAKKKAEGQTAMELTLKPEGPGYQFMGAGGNYYWSDGETKGMTRYTLDNLNISMARVGIWFTQNPWNPEEDKLVATDRKALVARDKPGSDFHRMFELQRELARRKIPYIASVWCLPDWLYTQKPPNAFTFNNHIAADKWPQVLECIGSYLKYAKDEYQAEPAYFSFNEAGGGCYVALSAEEHRDAIKKIGPMLASLGLKTRLLLGDNAHIQAGTDYLTPTTHDPEAMKYVGAVSVHSYRMTPPLYKEWADCAAKLQLPLIVAEVGVDPESVQRCRDQDLDYALKEMAMYQEIFLNARPHAALYWEYAGSCWSLLRTGPDGKLKMAERFCFQKHWCDLIPAGSWALATAGSSADVLFSAFRQEQKDGPAVLTLNISNPKESRTVRINGIPGAVAALNRVCTAKGKFFEHQDPVAIKNGGVDLQLPAQSLTTLTTLKLPALAAAKAKEEGNPPSAAEAAK